MSVGRDVGRDTGFVNVGARFLSGWRESPNMLSCFLRTFRISIPTCADPFGFEKAIGIVQCPHHLLVPSVSQPASWWEAAKHGESGGCATQGEGLEGRTLAQRLTVFSLFFLPPPLLELWLAGRPLRSCLPVCACLSVCMGCSFFISAAVVHSVLIQTLLVCCISPLWSRAKFAVE